jgi:hypothetical protein
MVRVVYNSCYGGFNLSQEACKRYWELQGKEVWIEQDEQFKSLDMFTVWLVPPEERAVKLEPWYSAPIEERIAYNKKHSEQTWYYGNVDRHDPILVQVVEELGDKANGSYAKLAIAEVSGPYRIDEYDGNESVETPGSYDWITP